MLAWLLGEPDGRRAETALTGADLVAASDLTLLECARSLTLLECARSLVRAVALSEIAERAAGRLHATLLRTIGHWRLIPISNEILARARQPFPAEPVRSLDAIHLASALEIARALPDVRLLSLDNRIRAAGAGLGLRMEPG